MTPSSGSTLKPRSLFGDLYEVQATASVSFTVDITVASGTIAAGLPFLLTVDR